MRTEDIQKKVRMLSENFESKKHAINGNNLINFKEICGKGLTT